MVTRTMGSALPSAFPYKAIPAEGWFRLLIIEPCTNPSATISCCLKDHEIDSNLSYEALSYTWGEEEANCEIHIDGYSFSVRGNLHTALHALRRSDTDRTLWVDAVCINQLDLEERNYQVRQMNVIFTKAKHVNVWLGKGDSDSDTGIDFLRRFYDTLQQSPDAFMARVGSTISDANDGTVSTTHSNLVQSHEQYTALYSPVLALLSKPQCIDALDAAVRLLCRSWWKRMWTLQESVLCRSVIVHCGSRSLPIACFQALSYFIYFSINFNAWPGAPIDTQVSLRATWRTADLSDHIAQRGRINLALALDSSWNRRATDPKDKIMGLLGLVGKRRDLWLEYTWSVAKIYRIAFAAALREEGDLSCLGFISERPEDRNRGLPSWVPDFEIHSEPGRDYITSISKPIFDSRTYNASSMLATDRVFFNTEEQDAILVLDGVAVDRVSGVGDQAPGWEDLPADCGEDQPRWRDRMKKVVQGWESMASSMGGTYLTGESVLQAFWRTILVDLKQAAYPGVSTAVLPLRLTTQDLVWLAEFSMKEKVDQLVETWELSCGVGFRQLRLIEQFNRRFFTTGRGYMGLGHSSLRIGDAICIFRGGAVTYALRATENGRWTYIGEW